MGDFAQWRTEYTPSRQSVAVCFDGALQAEFEQAEDSLRDLERGKSGMLDNGKAEMEARIEALRKKIKAKTRVLTFESIGKRAWDSLTHECPPTEEQQAAAEKAGGRMEFDPETFPVVAMARCARSPEMTEQDAQWLFDTLNEGDFLKVWDACLRANMAAGRNPFDPNSATRNGSRARSKPRSDSASRTASS